jgi:peptidoglycan/LPS O-acetylase OafA/YrhL
MVTRRIDQASFATPSPQTVSPSQDLSARQASAARQDLAAGHDLEAERAIETVDIPLERLRQQRAYLDQQPMAAVVDAVRPTPRRLPDPRDDAPYRRSPAAHDPRPHDRTQHEPGQQAAAQEGPDSGHSRPTRVASPQVAVSRRVAGLSGAAVVVLVVSGLASPSTSGGDWSATVGWPALQLLLVTIGYQLTTRALILDRPSLTGGRRLGRQLLALVGPIALPTLVVTAVAVATAAASGRLQPLDAEAAVGAASLTSNLFAIHGSNGPNGFAAGLGSTIGPAIDHLWFTALVAQFALLLAVLIGPVVGSLKPAGRPGSNTTPGSRPGRPAPAQTAALVAVIAATVAVTRLGLLALDRIDSASVVVHPLTGIDGLLVGAALALLPAGRAGRLNRSAGVIASAVAAGLFVVGASLAGTGGDPAWIWGVCAPMLAVAAAGIVSADVPVVARFLSSFSLRWLGQRAIGILIAYQLLGFALHISAATPAAADAGGATANGTEFMALPGAWDLVASVAVQLVFALTLGSVAHRYLQVPLVQAAASLGTARTSRGRTR